MGGQWRKKPRWAAGGVDRSRLFASVELTPSVVSSNFRVSLFHVAGQASLHLAFGEKLVRKLLSESQNHRCKLYSNPTSSEHFSSETHRDWRKVQMGPLTYQTSNKGNITENTTRPYTLGIRRASNACKWWWISSVGGDRVIQRWKNK